MTPIRQSANPKVQFTPSELPRVGSKLSLRCTKCGTTGRYDVGSVTVDPYVLKAETSHFEDAVFFSGYFHCRKCGAPGPWDLTTTTKLELLALMTQTVAESAGARITMAKFVLFDGTSHQTAALAEEHMKRLIDENPTDYFLWSRLGNLLRHAEQNQKAVEAYEKAIELNPQDIESHHNLGCKYLEDADRERAAEHFHSVLRFARDYPHRDRIELLRGMVRASLETLFDLHQESGGKIPLFPQIGPTAPQKRDELVVVHLMEFDLGRSEDWWRMADTFLPEYARHAEPTTPPRSRQGAETRAASLSRWESDQDEPDSETPEPIRRSARIGRNDPCPCGSGKKFKRCCGTVKAAR